MHSTSKIDSDLEDSELTAWASNEVGGCDEAAEESEDWQHEKTVKRGQNRQKFQ